MPPRKRDHGGKPQPVDPTNSDEPTTGPDTASGVSSATVDYPNELPEPVTVEEMTAEETAEAEARWRDCTGPDTDELGAASLAGLLGEVKELRERVADNERLMITHFEAVTKLFEDRLPRAADAITSPPVARPTILDGIQGIMLDVTGVGKHGQMDAAARMGNYKYQRYDDLKRELGAAFRKHDVFLQSTTTNLVTERIGEGGRMSRVLVSVTYRFTSLMDGSELTFDSHGESIDKSDKATGKAMTMALKTALIQAFMLAAEDTEEPDASRPEVESFDQAQQAVSRRREPHPTDADVAAAQRAARGPIARTPERVMHEAEQRVYREADPVPDGGHQVGDRREVAGQTFVKHSDGPGYPNDSPARADEFDTGPIADTRTPEEMAAAAVAALAAPGLTMEKWSAISKHAQDLELFETMVTTPDGTQMALKRYLVALGRTL